MTETARLLVDQLHTIGVLGVLFLVHLEQRESFRSVRDDLRQLETWSDRVLEGLVTLGVRIRYLPSLLRLNSRLRWIALLSFVVGMDLGASIQGV